MKYKFLFIYILFLTTNVFSWLTYPPYLHSWGIHRADSIKLKLFFPGLSFKNPFKLSAVRLIASDDKSTSKDDLYITVYGLDKGLKEIIFNTSMSTLKKYSDTVSDYRYFLDNPKGFTSDENGRLFICNSNKILFLSNNTQDLIPIEIYTNFKNPYDIDIVTNNILIISESNSLIFFNILNQQKIKTIKIKNPSAISVTRKTNYFNCYHINRIYFISETNKINAMNFSGEILKTILLTNTSLGFFDLGAYSRLYIPDKLNSKILILDKDLNYIANFGKRGKGNNEFLNPTSVTIHDRFGMVFISDKTGAQYYWLGTKITNITFKTNITYYTFSFNLTQPADIKIWLIDIFNKKKYIIKKIKLFNYFNLIRLNKEKIKLKRNNKYKFLIEANPLYSGKNRFIDKVFIYLK